MRNLRSDNCLITGNGDYVPLMKVEILRNAWHGFWTPGLFESFDPCRYAVIHGDLGSDRPIMLT